MMFINWWVACEFLLALVAIAVGVIGFVKAKRLSLRFARWGVKILCLPLSGLGILFLLLLLLVSFSGYEKDSSPIYSPSGKNAIRIKNFDEGATGGESIVTLYWAKGFRQKQVFSGDWGLVEPAGIRWVSDTELRIDYQGGSFASMTACESTRSVKVICTSK